MGKAIKALEEVVERWEHEYEVAVQTEDATHIAYLEGTIWGVKVAIEELSTLA